MKKNVILLLTTTILLGATAVFSGCQEETGDTSSMRRARLVADENIELKKQLAERDKEILNQKKLVEDCKQDMAKAQEQSGNIMLQMLQNLAQTGKEVETLTEENAQLKERITQLEAALAAAKDQ